MWPKRAVLHWKERPRLALHPATQGLTEHISAGLSVVVHGREERTQVSVRILYDNAKNPKTHVCAQLHVFQS